MKCTDARALLSPYLDSAVGNDARAGIERHLGECPACARRFEAEARVEHAIARALAEVQGDEQRVFAHAVERALGRDGAAALPPEEPPRLLLATRVALATLVVVTLALSGLLAWRLSTRAAASDAAELPALVVAAQQQHAQADPTGLVSGSPDEVNRFLLSSIRAPLGILALDEGWRLEGARVVELEGVAVGWVVLLDRGRRVSLFVLSESAAERFAAARTPRFALADGHALLQSDGAGLRLAIGATEPERLAALLGVRP